MFTGILSDGTIAIPLYDAQQERVNVAGHRIPTTSLVPKTNLPLDKANSIYVPQGDASARAWVICSRADVDRLDLYSNKSLTFAIDSSSITWKGLVLCREPQAIIPSYVSNDPLGTVLVELADARWRVDNPYRSVAANVMYNVPSNIITAAPTSYLAASLNSGVAWTWEEAIGDLWDLMGSQLGDFPGLPFTPDGAPVSWIFHGWSAWKALTAMLDRIGCAVNADLTQEPGSQFSIVQVGATDTTLETALTGLTPIHDGEFKRIIFDPAGARVCFRKVLESPTAIPPRFLGEAPYTVDVVGPNATAENAGIYHPIWDDLLAIYDDTNTLTNSAALSSRATERANDFFRRLGTGGGLRSWKRYSGLLNISPGSTLKAVTWRGMGNGAYTELAGHLDEMPLKRDYVEPGTAADMIRFGFPTPFTQVCLPADCDGDQRCLTVLGNDAGPCDEPGSGSGAACGDCDATDDEYCLTVTGVAGTSPPTTDPLSSFNGSFTVTRSTAPLSGHPDCFWQSPLIDLGPDFESGRWWFEILDEMWSIVFVIVKSEPFAGSTLAEQGDDAGKYFAIYGRWQVDIADWDCGSGLILPLTDRLSFAADFPDTVAITLGACASAPVVYFSSDDLCDDATSITIHGSGFTPTGNSVTFSPAGTAGTITYVSSHQLDVAITGQTAGALDATVTNSNGTSNTAQVATVVAAPAITPDTSDVNQSTGDFTFSGTGFVPGSTSVSFDSGTWTVVSVSSTSITVNFSVAPDLGALNATVTTACGTDTQEVANIVSGGGGGSAPSALGGSSTTAAWPTPLSYSVTLPSGSGLLVVNIYYPTVPTSNTVTANGSAMTVGKVEGVGPFSGNVGLIQQYYLPMTGPGSVTIAVTATIGTGAGILSNAYFLPSATTLDAFARAQANGGTADTGVSTSTTGAGGVVAMFGFTSASIGSLTWNSPFTGDASNDQHITLSGTDYWLVSGNTTIGSGVTFDAGIAGVTVGDWGGVGVSYK